MRRVPWRLSLKVSRKSIATVLAVAMSITFALVSLSIATALERDTLGIARNHPPRALVISSPDREPLSWGEISGFPGIIGVIVDEGVDESGFRVPTIAFLGDARDPVLVPQGWREVPAPFNVTAVDHAIVLSPGIGDRDTLERAGFAVRGAPALQSFFTVSGAEIARDLLLVVVFSSMLAVLFCYEFLRSEVREGRREIGIWRSVGMRREEVLLLFLARASAIGVVALGVGWSTAILLLNIAYERTGSEALRFALSALDAALLSLVFFVATILGGLFPAFVASRISVQRSLETDT